MLRSWRTQHILQYKHAERVISALPCCVVADRFSNMGAEEASTTGADVKPDLASDQTQQNNHITLKFVCEVGYNKHFIARPGLHCVSLMRFDFHRSARWYL